MHASKDAPAAVSRVILAVFSYTSTPFRTVPTLDRGKPETCASSAMQMVLHGYTNPLYPMIKTSAAPDGNAESGLKVALPSAAVAPG